METRHNLIGVWHPPTVLRSVWNPYCSSWIWDSLQYSVIVLSQETEGCASVIGTPPALLYLKIGNCASPKVLPEISKKKFNHTTSSLSRAFNISGQIAFTPAALQLLRFQTTIITSATELDSKALEISTTATWRDGIYTGLRRSSKWTCSAELGDLVHLDLMSQPHLVTWYKEQVHFWKWGVKYSHQSFF